MGDIPAYGPANVVFTNNALGYGAYGIFGSNVGSGNAAIDQYFSNSTFANNLFGDSPSSAGEYPKSFFFPTSWDGIFSAPFSATDFNPTDYASTSKYAATDGKPIGADVGLIMSAIAGVK